MWVLITIVVVFGIALLFARARIRAGALERFDMPRPTAQSTAPLSDAYSEACDAMLNAELPELPKNRKAQLAKVRELFDTLGDGDHGVSYTSELALDVPGEWVMAPNSDPSRRILYLHGGAFTLGSAKSHRAITAELAKRCGASVLAVDYRLMPEHPRIASIEDSRTAYRYIIANGPAGEEDVKHLAIAGDSAGANLTLMLGAWARDEGLRKADALVALAAPTDNTNSSPSMRANISTDLALGPLLGKSLKLPLPLLYLISWALLRMRPDKPLVSPLRGELADLPPTLLQVSSSEMLFDDSVRYANKASEAGSVTVLQSWPERLHVFQALGVAVPEVDEAFGLIQQFLADYGFVTGPTTAFVNGGDAR